MTTHAAFSAARTRVPDAPALVVTLRSAVWMPFEGTAEILDHAAVTERLRGGVVPLLCHAKAVARRLAVPPFAALDVLELFAFVRPARFCLPTPRGLAEALLLPVPATPEADAATLIAAARALLAELSASPGDDGADVIRVLADSHWPWLAAVSSALGEAVPRTSGRTDGLRVWTRLKEWDEPPPEAAPESRPVEPVEARARLVQLLGARRPRPQQMHYASAVAEAFAPRDAAGEPRVVLAEAGTGVGKTLGYIAPALVWAQKNHGPVWLSTYTRNLQRQLDQELDAAYPSRAAKQRAVVVRKGRENTLCLLNYEEAVARAAGRRDADTVTLVLIARWAAATRDGDMVGGDFPGWLADLLGPRLTVDLTDTRNECIYSACRHYRKCFIERSIRRARRAELVVANHALVLIQAARGDEQRPATRYVFDEGHHLFEAADSAFSLSLSGMETAELRRWLRGADATVRTRNRGLADRLGDIAFEDEEARQALQAVLQAALALPGLGWRQRLAGGMPAGPAEAFLALVRQQVYARSRDGELAYSLEADARPAVPGLVEAARHLNAALARIVEPATALIGALFRLLDAKTADLDTAGRQRIERLCRSLEQRAVEPIAGWREMLHALESRQPVAFIDWLGIDRIDGRDLDVGYHRHWLDPMQPFAALVLEPAHGVVVTSATLKDGAGDEAADWAGAEIRSGARHLAAPAKRATVPSPFDYAGHTRVFVITDIARDHLDGVAAAYRELFLAAGGGALGLFTAVQRLRAVHQRIAGALDAAGLPLLAQHVDGLDTGTLIDLFRAEADTCLLGTDAVRDGIDIPGRSLRLIVFDRVPWPRPTILHRARRQVFGGRRYDEMLTRLRLKQAYGRLIRDADDRGVFVMLDRQLPSRLCGAFPEGVSVERLGLAEAIAATREFLRT